MLKKVFRYIQFFGKRFNKYYQPEVPLYYFGHHKCASKWIHGIISDVCWNSGLKAESVDSPDMFDGNLQEFVRVKGLDFLSFVNADYNFVGDSAPYKGFHVIRDPRDVAVSAYFSHLYSHTVKGWPALEAHRAKLQTLDKDEGLLCDMEFISDVFEQIKQWNYSDPNVLELKMEELVLSPDEGFTKILDFLGVVNDDNRHLFKPLIHRTIHNWDFKKLSGGRKKGDENIKSHYRKGEPGDWKNHFNECHIRYFKEKYGNMCGERGYEPFS